jgi:hypothetical protein
MKVRVYKQRWTEGRESIHLHRDDINQFARDYFQQNPKTTIKMIGEPQEAVLNSGQADTLPKFGKWNK